MRKSIFMLACIVLTSMCFADTLIVDDDAADFPKPDFNTIQAAVDAAADGDLILVYPGTYTNADNSGLRGGGRTLCPAGEIPDCNGNCCPADWVGDGLCDDGSYDWNGVAIYLNCDEFKNDGGDCDGGSDPFGACCHEEHGCLPMTQDKCDDIGGMFLGDSSCWGGNPCGFGNQGTCPVGEIEDCNGNCCPADWLGDRFCDNDTRTWNDIPICLRCEENWCDMFDCLGGDGCNCDDESGQPVVDTLGKAITIRAVSGPEVTTMDALGKNRVVICDSGETSKTIIEGFTITGGKAIVGSPYGGGILCFNSSPTIVDCVITGNSGTDDPFGGGGGGAGIACLSSNPTIVNCTIVNNECTLGAGILCSSSSPTISSCTISNNSGVYGGGIYIGYESTPTITDCVISDNYASPFGGGIFMNTTGTVSLTGCVITSNYSAGIYISGHSPVITDTTVCGNNPYQIFGDWSDGGDVCVANSCYDGDNSGIPDGCECYPSDGEDTLDVPSEYPTIQAAIDAAVTGDIVLVSSGTYSEGGTESVVNPLGKAITIRSVCGPVETIIDGLNFYSGVVCNSGETNQTVIEGFTITHSYRAFGGGGIFCAGAPASSPSIINCIITSCSSGSIGGGILCMQPTSPRIIDCEISSNVANQYGGGIACMGGQPEISGCQITGNSALNGGGGGLLLGWETAAIVTDCVIASNSASYDGGGVEVSEWATPSLINCTIQGNSTDSSGGGLHAGLWSSVNLTNCTITNNFSQIGDGISLDTDATIELDGICATNSVYASSTSSIQVLSSTNWDVDGGLTTTFEGDITFQLDNLDADAPLHVNQELSQQGSLAITNDSGSLADAWEGDVIMLAEAGSLSGQFDSVVFPVMQKGLGLQLVEQSSMRGGGDQLNIEVITVVPVEFSNPDSSNLESPPVDIVDFDADGDGRDEIAILFGGTPGGVVAYTISNEGPPVEIDGLNIYVGNNPVTIDAGDINGDGLDDLLVTNSSDNTVSVIVTQMDSEGDLSFVSSSITVPGNNQSLTCGAIINWDGDNVLDAVVGVDYVDPLLEDAYQVLLDLTDSPSAGPIYYVPMYIIAIDWIADTVTAVDDDGGTGFVGGTRYGRVHHATPADQYLNCFGVLNGANVKTIESIDLDDDGGDGLEDVMVGSDEARTIYLFEGTNEDFDGYNDMIPVTVSEEMTDLLALDADGDGDMDIVMAVPTSVNPLILLRNDGTGQSLVSALGGRTWSKQVVDAITPFTRIASGGLEGKDDEDDWVSGGGNQSGALLGDPSGVLERTNIIFDSACPSDLNHDGVVGVDDLLLLIAAWGLCEGCPADLDFNGIVGVDDLLIVIAAWGTCP